MSASVVLGIVFAADEVVVELCWAVDLLLTQWSLGVSLSRASVNLASAAQAEHECAVLNVYFLASWDYFNSSAPSTVRAVLSPPCLLRCL